MKIDRRGFLKLIPGGLFAAAFPASIAKLLEPRPPLAETYSTYQSVGLREDLAQVIYNIEPKETPFLSLIGNATKVSGRIHDWQLDPLAAELHAKVRELQDDMDRVLLTGEPLRDWLDDDEADEDY